MYSQVISEFVDRESLPSSYNEDATQYIVPLANQIANLILESKETIVIGVNGAQGTGKTTLTKLLVSLLEVRGFVIANMSIDDFYLTKAERQQLAASKHPLLATRGVPGTHDVELLSSKIEELKGLEPDHTCDTPRFNKAADDRYGTSEWKKITGPVDAVILEGWFVGVASQAVKELKTPINSLEEIEDVDGSWRKYVNTKLAKQYQALFDLLSLLVMLKAPSFEQVFEWRSLQEEKLRKRTLLDASAIMDDEQLQRFIQHYERLTRHCLENLPPKADVLYELGSDHRISNVIGLET